MHLGDKLKQEVKIKNPPSPGGYGVTRGESLRDDAVCANGKRNDDVTIISRAFRHLVKHFLALGQYRMERKTTNLDSADVILCYGNKITVQGRLERGEGKIETEIWSIDR